MDRLTLLLIVFLYFAILFFVSWLTGRKSSGNETFFLANRRSPWYVVSIGMIGASLSGVSFVSVPGWVGQTAMTYMQMVFGFFFGYIVIAELLLPLYYRLHLTSIYTYIERRMGVRSYKTAASFFLLSKLIGAAVRLYLVVIILQTYVLDTWQIPFAATVIVSVLIVWLYTFRSGIKTIVWTDMIQTLFLIGTLVAIIWQLKDQMGLDVGGMIRTISDSSYAKIFEWHDWSSPRHFVKMFLAGVFIPIVMTGLDQDMMQKNLTCKNVREAKKNIYAYGITFIPINLLFLGLGAMLLLYASQQQITVPPSGDDLLPMFCTTGILGPYVMILFTIGIIAAAFSSVDSALTALTTSFCVDLLGVEKKSDNQGRTTRLKVHLLLSILLIVVIFLFRAVNDRHVIDAIYVIASYTYGPLLGLFAFGLFTKRIASDRFAPLLCLIPPLLCYGMTQLFSSWLGYRFGYELLLINGLLTFVGFMLLSKKKSSSHGAI